MQSMKDENVGSWRPWEVSSGHRKTISFYSCVIFGGGRHVAPAAFRPGVLRIVVGTITDQSGGTLLGATVTLTNVATGEYR